MSLRPRAVILSIVAVVLAACSTGEATTAPAPERADWYPRDRCGAHARGQRREPTHPRTRQYRLARRRAHAGA